MHQPRSPLHPSPVRLRLSQLLLLALVAAPAQAAPRLDWLLPSGGQRGATFRAQVGGQALDQITGVVSTGPGVTARVLPADVGQDPKTARTLEIAVAPDAPLGRTELRLFDGAGAGNPKFFEVGQFPESMEKEPNDSRSQAPRVSLPITLNGRIGQGADIDSCTFALQKGQEVCIEVHSLRLLGELGNTWLKGYAWIEDARGRTLAENDGYYRWDPYLQLVAPEDGDYTFAYRDIQYRGNPMGTYRVTIGVIPHVWSAQPLGLQRGARTEVRLLGANLGSDAVQTIEVPDDAPEGLLTRRFSVNGVWTNPLSFVVSRHPTVMEAEPNDTPAQATPVTVPCEASGRLEQAGDRDLFRVDGKKGDRLALEIYGDRLDLPLDSVVTLRKPDGAFLAENDDLRGQRDGRGIRDSRLDYALPADGEYLVQVMDADGRGGPGFAYRLSVAPPRPNFRLQVQNDRPVVRPGGSVTLDLTLERQDNWSGEVQIVAEGLPEGAQAAPLTLAANQTQGKLVLNCAAGVTHQAAVLRILGEGSIEGTPQRRLASTQETYNIQGTAYRRDLTGPVLVVGR